ncbi:MAG: metallophosphoesterase [Candidatus Eremiobacteraeota bacterium]|nr:metallophosphoesterase [Candidatus Eremiobacteraeota bacterium]
MIFATAPPTTAQVLAAWTQLGQRGAVIARAIVPASRQCPVLNFGKGEKRPLEQRVAPGGFFNVRVCETRLPRSVRNISLNGHPLPGRPQRLHRIAVIGDTGCRIEVVLFQGCNSPSEWPFPQIARRVAAAKPDLVIHVGDYYYRETPCMIPQCAGSPHGDGWPAWAADWFTPAAPIFARAPLLLVRGNHEVCSRGGEGWDRFLSQYPYGSCSDHEQAYRVGGNVRFVVVDSSQADDRHAIPAQVSRYRPEFDQVRHLGPHETWLVSHRPLWGLASAAQGVGVVNATLDASVGDPKTFPIELALAGHVHLFEALGFADKRPPQVIVGTGGDLLSTMPAVQTGLHVDRTTLSAVTLRRNFGYAIFDLDLKTLTWYTASADARILCRYGPGKISCTPLPS